MTPPPARRDHGPCSGLSTQKGPLQVDGERPVILLFSEIQKIGDRTDPGVIDHHIHTSQLRDSRGDQRIHISLARHIRGHRKHRLRRADFLGRACKSGRIHIGEHHFGTLRKEAFRAGSPDALRAARDDHDPVSKPHSHSPSSQ